MQADRFCAWRNHHVRDMHITNKEVTVGFCVGCASEIQRLIISANVRAEMPHRFPVADPDRTGPVPKLPVFEHGLEANN